MQEFQKIIEDFSDEVFLLKSTLAALEQEKGKFEDMDLYLIDNLFPALFPGLEELAKEVEKLQDPGIRQALMYLKLIVIMIVEYKIDENIRSRFNPCLFLAQYLMRNNPKYNPEQYADNNFLKYSERIRKTRHFQKVVHSYKIYFRVQNKQKELLSMRDMETIVKHLDNTMSLDDKLLTDLGSNKKIIQHKEDKIDIQIDEFYDEFSKTVIENDFIKIKDLVHMESELRMHQ